MTRKDVLQIELDFLNSVIANVVLGAMIGVAIYSLQSSSDKLIPILIVILILGALASVLRSKYNKLLDELEKLP